MTNSSIVLADFVQNAIQQVIESEKFLTQPKVTATTGSDSGDGYTSKTTAVAIIGDGRELHLFIKYFAHEITEKCLWTELFRQEINFYTSVYPKFLKFQQDRGIRHPFDNVPKYYFTKINKFIEPIVLENLKMKGYILRDRYKQIDDAHISLMFTTYAKFHAISYAMKDQDPIVLKKMYNSMSDLYTCEELGLVQFFAKTIDSFVKNLDPVHDEHLLVTGKGLAEHLLNFFNNINDTVDEYAVITQGDCWSNNMMFLYDEKSGIPQEIKLVDWQVTRVHSPVMDLSYAFYSIATKEMMENVERYMQLYYEHLSKHIRNLGSDPNILYPYKVFEKHWKMFSKFGFLMSFGCLKAMLSDSDEAPNITNASLDGEDLLDGFTKEIRNQAVYYQRLKDILQHFVDKSLLI